MQKINGKTRICGLIGNPVEHTLSPLIHNTLAQKKGQNFVYVPFQVEKENLEDAVKGAKGLHILGMNVTVPYKSQVIPYLKEIDALAGKIGAVNTLVSCQGGYKGYNTDMTGLKRALMSEGICLEKEKVILIGAGGAARAVAFMCADAGVKNVYLLNRTIERAVNVAKEVNRASERECISPMPLADYRQIPDGKYLVIQGTSAGLYPHTEEAAVTEEDFYELAHTGYDLIYKPAETRFMKLVKAHGGKAYNGLKMLAYQAIDAYELWNGEKVSEEEAEFIIQKLKEEIKENG